MAMTWRQRLTVLLLGLIAAAGVALGALYYAARQVPEFYTEAIAISPAVAEKASDEFSDGAFALANDIEKVGSWSALFTDEQVNGWLATDLVKKHPELLPPGFKQPRIKLLEDHGQVGVRYTVGGMPTVAWIDVAAVMVDANEVAIRFRHVRAGAVPLPMATILEAVSKAAKTLEVPLRWATLEGHPTAVIGLPQSMKKGLRYELTKLKVAEGKLFISGRTFRQPAPAAAITQ